MSNVAKDIRKQIKNVAQEILTNEVKTELYAALQKEITQRMESLANEVRTHLKGVEQRQLDTQSYLMREIAKSSPGVPEVVDGKIKPKAE